MILRDPDARRGLRSIVQAVVAILVIVIIWIAVRYLKDSAKELYGVTIALCVIVGLGTLLYGAENVTRAVRFKGPFGMEGGIGEEDAAQQVADAAQIQADEIKGA
jgi:hypothetical protein